MLTIIQSPNPILRTPAQDVTFSGPKLQKIIDEMIKTMVTQKDPDGVGLAANQVNLPWKIFIARFSTKKGEPVRVFINPEMIDHSEELQADAKDKKDPLEGCLSKPNYYGAVKRWKTVTLKYQIPRHSGEEPATTPESLTHKENDSGPIKILTNFQGKLGQNDNLIEKTEKFSDFAATVIQHEMDHLNGKLFIERILEQKGKLYLVTGKDSKGKEKWEEVEI